MGLWDQIKKYNKRMESMYTDGRYFESNPGWHSQDAAWKLTHVQRALARAGMSSVLKTVCDVGCGSGELVKEWASQRPDMQFTGCDISPQAHAMCINGAPENTHFVHGGQVGDARFDAILLIDVLEHVPDTDGFLSILEKHSDLFVFHVPLDLSARSLLKPEILEEERRHVGHIHFFTAAYLKRLLKARGYEVLSWHYTNKYVECPPEELGFKSRVGMKIRQACHFFLPRCWAALSVGGYSVMAVVRRARNS